MNKSQFIQLMSDPDVKRLRGKNAPKQNLVISTQNGRQVVDWTCAVCGYRNHHLWFGRDVHICNKCEQPTELKGQTVEPITNV